MSEIDNFFCGVGRFLFLFFKMILLILFLVLVLITSPINILARIILGNRKVNQWSLWHQKMFSKKPSDTSYILIGKYLGLPIILIAISPFILEGLGLFIVYLMLLPIAFILIAVIAFYDGIKTWWENHSQQKKRVEEETPTHKNL